LFSESNARFIVTTNNEHVEKLLSKINAPAAVIGVVEGKKLIVNRDLINVDVDVLKESYHGVIENFMA